jgi:hypothetical protein
VTDGFGWGEILAAAVGAIAAGVFSVVDRILERRRRREATLVALASEVQAICNLITSQGYFEQFRALADQIRAGAWNGASYVIDIRGNYFKIFDGLSMDLGLLDPAQVSKIVSFYTYCQSAIDSTRPDGPLASEADAEDRASNVIGVEGVFMAILHLGEEIVAFPKRPLPVIEAE